MIEAPTTQGGFGLKVSDRDLRAATVLAAWENGFHPVREYLSGLVWDRVPRVERLFIDFMGSEDNRYYRDVARLMLIAAVTRVFEPGCKWDTAIILEGAQGRGKSTFIRILGRRWFSELDGNFHDGKEMVEKMQGSWILEMPELNGFMRSEVQSIKAFISRQVDKVRLAYEARAVEFPRQSILIGSTNDREYLKDNTGGRRFLPVECRVEMIDFAGLGRDAYGDPVVADLAELQHLLIVGRQGAGKTNAIHAILQSLLFRFGTARLWLLVAGSRATDYTAYENIPHMLAPVAATGESLTERLTWLEAQLEHRQRLIRAANARAFESYNRHVQEAAARGEPLTWRPEPAVELDLPFLARIVTVVDSVDELSGGEAWPDGLLAIVHRGAQVGLHLVIVARTPGVRPLEDLLRQGSVARLCLQTATPRMSQALIGLEGAEMLGMNGDAYLLPPNAPVRRVHLPLVVEEELEAVGNHWRAQGEPLALAVPEGVVPASPSPEDELYEQALELVVAQGRASTSYLQRALRIGYNNAAALVARMEREGHVGRPDAIGRREVTSLHRVVSDDDVRVDVAKGKSWIPWWR